MIIEYTTATGETEVMRETTANLLAAHMVANWEAIDNDHKLMSALVFDAEHGYDYTKQNIGLAEKKYPAGA